MYTDTHDNPFAAHPIVNDGEREGGSERLQIQKPLKAECIVKAFNDITDRMVHSQVMLFKGNKVAELSHGWVCQDSHFLHPSPPR